MHGHSNAVAYRFAQKIVTGVVSSTTLSSPCQPAGTCLVEGRAQQFQKRLRVLQAVPGLQTFPPKVVKCQFLTAKNRRFHQALRCAHVPQLIECLRKYSWGSKLLLRFLTFGSVSSCRRSISNRGSVRFVDLLKTNREWTYRICNRSVVTGCIRAPVT